MRSHRVPIVLAVIITAIIVGGGVYLWQSFKTTAPDDTTNQQPPSITSNIKEYTSETYSFKYPGDDYSIVPPTTPFPVLTIEKARNKRAEIFQLSTFHDRSWGFDGTETQENIDGYVPKETLTVKSGDTQYDVWLYYVENDTQTKAELHNLFDSIVIK